MNTINTSLNITQPNFIGKSAKAKFLYTNPELLNIKDSIDISLKAGKKIKTLKDLINIKSYIEKVKKNPDKTAFVALASGGVLLATKKDDKASNSTQLAQVKNRDKKHAKFHKRLKNEIINYSAAIDKAKDYKQLDKLTRNIENTFMSNYQALNDNDIKQLDALLNKIKNTNIIDKDFLSKVNAFEVRTAGGSLRGQKIQAKLTNLMKQARNVAGLDLILDRINTIKQNNTSKNAHPLSISQQKALDSMIDKINIQKQKIINANTNPFHQDNDKQLDSKPVVPPQINNKPSEFESVNLSQVDNKPVDSDTVKTNEVDKDFLSQVITFDIRTAGGSLRGQNIQARLTKLMKQAKNVAELELILDRINLIKQNNTQENSSPLSVSQEKALNSMIEKINIAKQEMINSNIIPPKTDDTTNDSQTVITDKVVDTKDDSKTVTTDKVDDAADNSKTVTTDKVVDTKDDSKTVITDKVVDTKDDSKTVTTDKVDDKPTEENITPVKNHTTWNKIKNFFNNNMKAIGLGVLVLLSTLLGLNKCNNDRQNKTSTRINSTFVFPSDSVQQDTARRTTAPRITARQTAVQQDTIKLNIVQNDTTQKDTVKIAPITNIKTENVSDYVVKKGDNVWNITKRQLKKDTGYKAKNSTINVETRKNVKDNNLHYEQDNYTVIIHPGDTLKIRRYN